MGGRLPKISPDKPVFWALLALLVWLPVPLGSNRGWAWGLMEVAAFALIGWWLVLWAMGRVALEDPLRRSWPVFAALGAWVMLQGLAILHAGGLGGGALAPLGAGLGAHGHPGNSPRPDHDLHRAARLRVALLKTLAYGAIAVIAYRALYVRPTGGVPATAAAAGR